MIEQLKSDFSVKSCHYVYKIKPKQLPFIYFTYIIDHISLMMKRRVFLVEKFIHMLIVIRLFTTHLFPFEFFLPFLATMLVAQYFKQGLTPILLVLMPLLALQIYGEVIDSIQIQYIVAILGGALHFIPMKMYWLPEPLKAVGFREDSLEEGLHYSQFHPLQGEVKLRSMRWHTGREVNKMLDYKGLTNKLVRKIGHLIFSYVDHLHLKVAQGKEKETDSAIAFCHGRGGTVFMYSSYLMHLAGLSFRVGGVQHTDVNNTGLKVKEEIKKYREKEVQVRAAQYYQTILEVGKGKKNIILMGHSYGCATVIQAYHSLQPEIKTKISHVILLDPWLFPLTQAKFDQQINCPVLVLANEDFLKNPDMYQRMMSYTTNHKLQFIIWKDAHHNHQTDMGFVTGNILDAVKNSHMSKVMLELNLSAIERFLKGERVEGTFGERDLGRKFKPDKFYPENKFNL